MKNENWFSFNKISLIKSKKYKNIFEKVEVEIFTDEEGERYLVTEEDNSISWVLNPERSDRVLAERKATLLEE